MSKKAILFFIFLLSILLRLIYFKESITFGYDQARDAFQAIEIWTTDHFKILGPRTDFVGLHHGPLYWYLISPVYYFTKGNIWAVRLFLILLNSLNIFLIFAFTKELFKSKKVALTASFFYTISFEVVQYARWLSNPSLALITSTISFWALWKLIQGKHCFLPVLILSWGASFQFEFFMVYQIFVFVLIWILIKGFKTPRISKKTLTISLFTLTVSLFPFLASEIKFNFQGFKSLSKFLLTQSFLGTNFLGLFFKYINNFVSVFFLNLWGINLFFAGVMSFLTIYLAGNLINIKFKDQTLFLIAWIFSPILLHLFTGTNGVFVNLGAGVGAIILTSYLLFELTRKLKARRFYLFLAVVILIGNLILIFSQNKRGEILFSVQEKMILGDELKAIDWIYSQSRGQIFRINTVTNPLFINTTWAYLFDWYAKSKYGYMPIWWGEAQVNVFGDKVKFSGEREANLHYLIIEPGPGIPSKYIRAIRQLENTRSKIIKEKKIGNFTVEKRKVTKPRIFTSKDVFYLLNNPPIKNSSSLKED